MSWWSDWREEQDSDPEYETEVLKRTIAEAESKVRMAADNLCSLWPVLKSEKKKTQFSTKDAFAETVLRFRHFRINIVCGGGNGLRPTFSFSTAPCQLNEEQVAELIGVAKRF